MQEIKFTLLIFFRKKKFCISQILEWVLNSKIDSAFFVFSWKLSELMFMIIKLNILKQTEWCRCKLWCTLMECEVPSFNLDWGWLLKCYKNVLIIVL